MIMKFNNITTIASLIAAFIAPILVKVFNFNVDVTTLTAIFVFLIVYVSARNPNTFKRWGNDLDTLCEYLNDKDVEEVKDNEIEY